MAILKKNLVFFCFLLVSKALAQEPEPKSKTWIAGIDALQLVDVMNYPTLKLFVEKKITPAFSIVAAGGFQLYEPYKNYDTLYIKASGFKLDLEARAYVLKMINPQRDAKSAGLFVGLQGFYRENKFTGNADYIKIGEKPNDELTTRYTEDFGVRKKVIGANITSGWQKSFRSFVFEPSIGFGIMDRKIKNNDLSFNPAIEEFDYNHGNGIPRTHDKSGTAFNLSLSFKVGYQF